MVPAKHAEKIRAEGMSQEKRTTARGKRDGILQFRISRAGKPYVNISKTDIEALMAISQDWMVKLDVAANPPLTIMPRTSTTTFGQSLNRTKVQSIRVYVDDWRWFVQECRANGTSTCHEIRRMLRAAREESEYPPSVRRGILSVPRYVS